MYADETTTAGRIYKQQQEFLSKFLSTITEEQ